MSLVGTIRHREFEREGSEPIVHNLGFIPEGKQKTTKTIGMMKPGMHDFGVIQRDEEIEVTDGAIKINGTLYSRGSGKCIIKPGDRVVFIAEEVSSYMCNFPNETR